MGFDLAEQYAGHHVSYLMGYRFRDKLFRLSLGNGEVVANDALFCVTDHLPGGEAGQVETDVDFRDASFPGLAEQRFGLGEVLFGDRCQFGDKLPVAQDASSLSTAR